MQTTMHAMNFDGSGRPLILRDAAIPEEVETFVAVAAAGSG